MSSAQYDTIYKTPAQIVQDVLAGLSSRISDASITPESVWYIWAEVFGDVGSGFFLALQLLHDDMFVQSMSILALQREGEETGRPQKGGVLATGTVTLSGAGGTFVGSGSQVGAPQPALGTTLFFETTEDVTIPDPGVPAAPTATDAGTSGNPTGTLEYAVTFLTAKGETALGASSGAVSVMSHQVSLTSIPLGGDGTTGRNIYRSKNGGAFKFVAELANNTATTYTDNIADGSLGGNPPGSSTAEQVDVTAQSLAAGAQYNVGVGAINVLVDVDGDVTGATNAAVFAGGEDPEAVEVFRQALLRWKQSPQSGGSNDLIAWATSIDGIDTAAVFKNVNASGSSELGSVVVRVSGPSGAIPDSDTITAAQSFIDSKDLANITIYVVAFTPVSTDVTAHVIVSEGYVLADVSPTVEAAIAAYINSIPAGGIAFYSGLVAAAFGLPGVDTVTITDPVDDVTSADSEKLVAGTISIFEDVWS